MTKPGNYTFAFGDIDKTMLATVGGKGASLGELSRIEGVHVPGGFCVSTEGFREMMGSAKDLHGLLKTLAILEAGDRREISETSAKIRKVIEGTGIPEGIDLEIMRHLKQLGENTACAVRSSATAEDLPTASFAGQQDTYLNVAGKEEILKCITKCWASLFSERAIIYRLQNGFDHRRVRMSVVVQQMIFPSVAGILFTADPVTGNRKVSSIDASFGLGEALVSGLVNPDNYKILDGRLVDKKVSIKKRAIYAVKGGGTKEVEIESGQQMTQALTDEQVIQLEAIGRKIEAHFGSPQDIEWCLADDEFYIVQSRPITTLYPVPEANDGEKHVYVSVGHQQMMTDPIKPLGLSFYLLATPASMRIAGGRLFVDITPMLASPAGRKTLEVLGKSDPLIKGALTTIIDRADFIKERADDQAGQGTGKNQGTSFRDYQTLKDYDPAIVSDLVRRSEASIYALKEEIQVKSGDDLFDFILEDIRRQKAISSNSESFGVIMTGMNASSWINEKMQEWLGERNAADAVSQSAPNNVTSEMGRALLDVADVARPYPEVIDYLQRVKDDNFLRDLANLEGGKETRDAILDYLDKYGMRCVGEIDITKTRWSEKPAALLPALLANIRNFGPGESQRKFEQGRQEALKKEQTLLAKLKRLPDGEQKAEETKRMISLVRNFIGYREYPKYAIVSRSFVYKQALMKEAERLVQAGVIHQKEDIYYLSFEELREVVRTHSLDYGIIGQRKEEYRSYEKLTPPRVITSEGEIISGKYNRDHLPTNSIAGLAVSSGVIEGRARVILSIENADLKKGDILVTAFTDPSWTPLFVSIKGLVTEVGGLMTHGAVIAREYGLPAVVGVENATRLIKDGQKIRVNGTDGYVEIL